MVAMSIAIDDDTPVFSIEEIDVGPLPVPAALLEELTNQVNQTLLESLDGVPNPITAIQTGEGQMTVTAQTTTGN